VIMIVIMITTAHGTEVPCKLKIQNS